MEDSERQSWSANITVRAQIAAFLGGTFFAVLLLFVSQERMRSLLLEGDRLTVFTAAMLTITFTAFAFSAFAQFRIILCVHCFAFICAISCLIKSPCSFTSA